VGPVDRGVGVDGADENLDLRHDARLLILVGTHNGERSRSLTWQHTRKTFLWEFTMEKNNSADSWFNFKPMVGGRITSGARKHKLFNEVRLVIGDFELSSQFKTRGPRGPWVAHLRIRSKVTVEPIIENPRGII